MSLKPQDIMVALKLCCYRARRPAISIVAAELSLSPSEVHGGLKRLQHAKLLHGPELDDAPNVTALEEFLLHGLKYAFPATHGEPTRGLPTSYAAPPLVRAIRSDDLPPVWSWHEGPARGISLEPLYKTAPIASIRDPLLYELLALSDAVRDGRARERKIAERELVRRLRAAHRKP